MPHPSRNGRITSCPFVAKKLADVVHFKAGATYTQQGSVFIIKSQHKKTEPHRNNPGEALNSMSIYDNDIFLLHHHKTLRNSTQLRN